MKRTPVDDIAFEESSGNVFADAGLEDADELLIRADLIIVIQNEIESRGLTQMQASAMIGLTQSDISNIVRSKVERFSQERLMEAIRRLGLDIRIDIRPSKSSKGTVSVLRSDVTVRST